MNLNSPVAGAEMAVRAFTDQPAALLSAIKKAINDEVVTTWTIDADGDLTHTSAQWAKKAWMRPKIMDDRLLFNIIAPKDVKMSKTTYGVYHARLIQTLLIYFDGQFKTATATAMATSGDQV